MSLAELPALHRFATAADDLTVDATGHIWVSSPGAGRIDELTGSGAELASFGDAAEPEGLVPLPGGDVVVAEQGPNRLDRLAPATGALTPLLRLPNPTANLGVDGISAGAGGAHLLVPDSPTGQLLELPVGGGAATTLATALGRPVAAAQLAGGTFVVASESSVGLRVVRGGAVRALGTLSDLDEVVPAAGLLYVTSLRSGELLAVDPSTGASRVLVTGAPSPQGLAALPDGRLLLVDSVRRELVEVPPCT